MDFIYLITIVLMSINRILSSISDFNILDYIAPIITFIIGVVTIVSNFYFNKKNNETIKELKSIELNANIIANARINWLESVRNHTADFIKNTYSFKNEIIMNKDSEKYKESYENFNKSFYLLKLYFTENKSSGKKNEDHKNILQTSREIHNHVNNQVEYVLEEKGEFDEEKLDELIETFTITTSIYFKKVWEEAKNI